ncbi:MAG: HAD family hydrolase [Bacteroidota bacterium]
MPAPTPIRIACWSGPRNISTALMRSWGSRADTAVVDEPFYAHYLWATGLDHPGRAAILGSQPTDWRTVAAALTGPAPGGKDIFYQKHMAHHLLPGMVGPWLGDLRHAFLLREPAAMLTSLAKVLPDPRPEDTGLPQQVALVERLRDEAGRVPPVIDAEDVLTDPPRLLRLLCEALGVPFEPAMLTWEAGPRPTDGVWAAHWYAAVEASTGFKPYRPKTESVPERLQSVLAECKGYYAQLHPHRLR